MSKNVRRLKALVVFGLCVGIAAMVLSVWQKRHIYHLAVVQEGILYRDGFKSEGQFAATLENVHPRTVVSLLDGAEQRDPRKSQFFQEQDMCSSRGIKLERIPVSLGGWPSTEDIQQFLTIVSDPKNQPVLVHCAQGVRRTGFFVAAYQESVLGYSKAKAENAILTFGHSDTTVEQIRRFLDGYDPKSQIVSVSFGRSAE
jgi:protein tyrosine/serine phosphatase